MKKSELKKRVQETGSCFFERETMRFFGDTMKNYGVRKAEINGKAYWELYRKNPVKHGRKRSVYFSADTFERVLK